MKGGWIMRKNTISKVKFVVVMFLIAAMFLSPITSLHKNVASAASSAILKVSPPSGSCEVGSSFPVAVKVDTGGEAINAFKAYLTFPADKLEVTGVDISGSFATFWIEHTSDNVAGYVHLQGGLPTPGFTGSDGLIATITFKAKASGTAAVTFDSSCLVLRNSDSTNILASVENGSYTLGAITPPVLDHFEFAPIANQVAGVPFSITVTAKDQFNATYTGFTGNVALTVNKGSISPTTLALVNGVGTGSVTVSSSRVSVE